MAKTGFDKNDVAIRAFNHPLRRRILRRIYRGATDSAVSPREISYALDEPLSNVSYHVRILASCGAIALRETKPIRGSMQHFYSPCPKFTDRAWVAAVLDALLDDAE